MAKTLPTTWTRVQMRESQPGEPLAVSIRDELHALNAATSRVGAKSVRDVLVQWLIPGGLTGVSGSGSYDTEGFAAVRVSPGVTSLHVTLYAREITARLTVAGVTPVTLGGSATTDFTTTTVSLSGATVDGSGHINLKLELTADDPDHVFIACCVGEVPLTALPDGATTTIGEWITPDDATLDADKVYDAYISQRLFDNAAAVESIRCRAIAAAYCRSRAQVLSSVYERADGPYTIILDGHATSLRVTVIVTASGGDVTIFPFSEYEDPAEVRASRIQTVSPSSPTTLTWSGIRVPTNREGDFARVYLAVQGEVTGSLGTVTPTLLLQGPDFLQVEDVLTPTKLEALGPDTTGLAVRIKNPTSPAWSEETPALVLDSQSSTLADLAQIVLSNATPDDHLLTIWISPRPGTRGSPGSGRLWPGDGDTPEVEILTVSTLLVDSVWLECEAPAATRARAQRPRRTPSSSVPDTAARRITRLSANLTPQLLSRHPGNRAIVEWPGSAPGPDIGVAGAWWMHVKSDTSADFSALPVICPTDPNQGATTDLIVQRMHCQILYALALVSAQGAGYDEGTALFRWSVDTVYHGAVQLRDELIRSSMDALSVTAADLSRAPQSYSVDSIDQEALAYSWTQQVTWPRELGARHTSTPWKLSPVISAPLPASYPAAPTIQIGAELPGTAIVVAGAWAWYDARTDA